MDEIKMSFWDEKEAKRLFQKHWFYNTFIKHLKNIDLRHELLFYDGLSMMQVLKAFKIK